MTPFSKRYGPWALVTGASSGIGAEFGVQLAARGMNVVLAARRQARLEQLSASLRERYGVETEVLVLDLTAADVGLLVERATAKLDIGLLVNSAGAALTGSFSAHALADELAQLDLNCRAPLILTHLFARRLIARGGGGIINVCSLSAMLPMPKWSHYAATKAYGLHLSAGLWHELAAQRIDVLALCPGATASEFAEVAGIHQGGMAPSKVVASALARLGRGPVVVPGAANKLRSWLLKWVPRRKSIDIGAKVVALLQDQPPAGGLS